MTPEVLELEPNIPIAVSLKYPSGKLCKNGRMFYSLTDGRSLFLPPYVDEKIRRAQIRAGQSFQILMTGEPGKATDYEVTPLSPPPEKEVRLAGIQPSPCLHTGQSQFILAQVIAAIEVAHAAETYAARIGRPVQFSAEDIRALAISCFISQSREVDR